MYLCVCGEYVSAVTRYVLPLLIMHLLFSRFPDLQIASPDTEFAASRASHYAYDSAEQRLLLSASARIGLYIIGKAPLCRPGVYSVIEARIPETPPFPYPQRIPFPPCVCRVSANREVGRF